MSNFLSELIGTMMLIILGNGVVAGVLLKGSKAENGGWIVITMAWGLAVTMAIYAVGSFSGAHINPAVTLALVAAGALDASEIFYYLSGQMLGAMIGAAVVWLHYLPHWRNTEDMDLKLACYATAPAIRKKWANLLSEVIGTFILLLALMFIGANEFSKGLNPLIVGFLIVSIGLSLGGTTGYAINPARDLGPRLAHFILPIAGKGKSDWSYSWIPVVGPVIGGVYGAVFYNAVFLQEMSLMFFGCTVTIMLIIVLAVLEDIKKD